MSNASHPPRPLPAPQHKGQIRSWRLLVRLVRGLAANNAFEAAAAIAFWFFLSLVPLLFLLGYVVGRVARTHGVDELIAPLLNVIPGSAEGLVRKEVDRLERSSASSIAPLGLAGFLWTASSGLHNLMRVFEGAVSAKRRPWWKVRFIAVGWVVLGLATGCLLSWLLVQSDSAFHAADATAQVAMHARGAGPLPRHVHNALQTPRQRVIAAVLLLASGMILLAGFYRLAVERPPGVERRVWAGTVTAVVFWLVVSWAFGEYAVSITNYAIYYGGLAAVAVLLLWLYLTSLSLVLGAEVNAEAERVRPRS